MTRAVQERLGEEARIERPFIPTRVAGRYYIGSFGRNDELPCGRCKRRSVRRVALEEEREVEYRCDSCKASKTVKAHRESECELVESLTITKDNKRGL